MAQAGARLPALRVAPALLLVALLVSGCNFLGIGSSGGSSGSGQITVAVVPGIDNAPLRVAHPIRAEWSPPAGNPKRPDGEGVPMDR